MNREIKFRAWNNSGEFKMLYVNELSWCLHDDGVLRVHFSGNTEHGSDKNGVLHSGFGACDLSEKVGEWQLMQYTGLKDKNGREIYEADIIQFTIICEKKATITWCFSGWMNFR